MKGKKQILVLLFLLCFVSVSGMNAWAESSIQNRKEDLQDQEEVYLSTNKDLSIDEISSLDDYIRIALLNNPDLKSAFYNWKSSFKKISAEFSLPDPQVSYTNYLESVETRVGPQEHAYSIMQKIPLPDKLWIKKSKQFKASEAAFYQFENKKLDLVYQVTAAYYEYAYLARSIEIMEENITLLKNIERVARAKYSSGMEKNHR